MFRKLANRRALIETLRCPCCATSWLPALACGYALALNLPFLGSANRLKCIAHDILGHRGPSRLAVIASRAEVNASKDTRIYDFGKCRRKVWERTHHPHHHIGIHAEGSCFAKVVRKHGCRRA